MKTQNANLQTSEKLEVPSSNRRCQLIGVLDLSRAYLACPAKASQRRREFGFLVIGVLDMIWTCQEAFSHLRLATSGTGPVTWKRIRPRSQQLTRELRRRNLPRTPPAPACCARGRTQPRTITRGKHRRKSKNYKRLNQGINNRIALVPVAATASLSLALLNCWTVPSPRATLPLTR